MRYFICDSINSLLTSRRWGGVCWGRNSVSGAVALASAPSFAERGFDLLERIDYRRADSEQEREAIYRLRYQAYLREGAIPPNSLKELSDRYDEMPNAWTFGIYIDDKLASSIRVCVGSPTHPLTPATNVFSDILLPEVGGGKTLIDPNRFVTDPDATPGVSRTALPHGAARLRRLRILQDRHRRRDPAARARGVLQARVPHERHRAGAHLPDADQGAQPDVGALPLGAREDPVALSVLPLDLLRAAHAVRAPATCRCRRRTITARWPTRPRCRCSG